MGIDCCIYFRAEGAVGAVLDLPAGALLADADEREEAVELTGATHEICSGWRYWSPTYPRGPWPLISATLLALLASPGVAAVWYCGDTDSGAGEPFTLQRLTEFNAAYVGGQAM